jgi:hypothetical protein
LWIKMTFCKVPKLGATIETRSHQRARKDLQVTLRVFFFALDREFFANSSPEVKHRHNLYPAVIQQNGITSPNL